MSDKSALGGLPPASFDGIKFPVEMVRVRGGIRDHIHEYIRSPAGQPEKLGRKNYVIAMTALFHDVIRAYPDLYPYALDKLVRAWESETTGDLVVPNVGPIRAYCRNWDRTLDVRVRSGERVELEFVEDSENNFLAEELIDQRQQSLAEKERTLIKLRQETIDENKHEPLTLLSEAGLSISLFDAITGAVTSVLAIRDQVELYDNLLAARIEALIGLCQQCERLAALQDVRSYRVLDALQELWLTALELRQDLLRKRAPIQMYAVPRLMAIGQVSIAIYGVASRAVEILQLNPIDDALAIPTGTQVRYYADAP